MANDSNIIFFWLVDRTAAVEDINTFYSWKYILTLIPSSCCCRHVGSLGQRLIHKTTTAHSIERAQKTFFHDNHNNNYLLQPDVFRGARQSKRSASDLGSARLPLPLRQPSFSCRSSTPCSGDSPTQPSPTIATEGTPYAPPPSPPIWPSLYRGDKPTATPTPQVRQYLTRRYKGRQLSPFQQFRRFRAVCGAALGLAQVIQFVHGPASWKDATPVLFT